jgi:hypothetical protein
MARRLRFDVRQHDGRLVALPDGRADVDIGR